MRGLLALLLVGLLALAPAAGRAQDGIGFWPSTSGANSNLNNTYENVGFGGATGTGTDFTSGSANAPGSYSSLGTTTAAFAGFYLILGKAEASTTRYLVSVSLDGGTTTNVPNLYYEPASTSATVAYWIPLNVSAGATIQVKVQANTAGAHLNVAVLGQVRNASSPPLFSSMVNINTPDTANTRAPATDVTFTSGSSGWVSLNNSTAATYGQLLAVLGDTTVSLASTQMLNFILGVGPSGGGSEVEIYRTLLNVPTGSSALARIVVQRIESTIASGQRISARVVAATPGTDALRVALYGFVP